MICVECGKDIVKEQGAAIRVTSLWNEDALTVPSIYFHRECYDGYNPEEIASKPPDWYAGLPLFETAPSIL